MDVIQGAKKQQRLQNEQQIIELHCACFKVIWFIFLLLFTVDQIYHLASPASPPNYMYNPIKTLKTNTIGTLNMLGE